MQVFFNLAMLIFGLIIGSFLNCVIYRLETRRSFLKGRSFCPHCEHTLSWQDLIPILSFISLRGKCRYCRQKISWQYPLVELATGLIFFLIFCFLHSVFYVLISCFLIIIFVYDLKHYIIPDSVVYPAIALALIFNFQFLISKQFSTFNFLILSAIGAALFFLLIVLVSKGKWMGIGDIKLAFLMGLLLGWPKIFVALFLAFFIGAAIGLVLIWQRKKTMKSEVPFGPFLVAAVFLALFLGEKLINWYGNLFLIR